MGVISPGEPFHIVPATPDWVLSWYPARVENKSLVGPRLATLITEISRDEYLQAVRQYMQDFTTRITDGSSPGSQAYAILSMCRGLYTLRFGETLSKMRAADWARQQFPQWGQLIDEAVGWRRHQWQVQPECSGVATVLRTKRFVSEVLRSLD